MATFKKKFDKNCPNWDEIGTINEALFKANQDWFNSILQARGYMFLRECYDTLGIPLTKESCTYGWVKGVVKEDEDCVNFSFVPIPGGSDYELIFKCYPILNYLPEEDAAE